LLWLFFKCDSAINFRLKLDHKRPDQRNVNIGPPNNIPVIYQHDCLMQAAFAMEKKAVVADLDHPTDMQKDAYLQLHDR
jgi:hypothetical protein